MSHDDGKGPGRGARAILQGKSLLVTGGGTGIGRAIAIAFAAAGARVVVAGRRSEPLQETVRQIRGAGGEAAMAKGDITRQDSVELLVNSAVYNFEGLDILINNAAIYFPGSVEKTTERRWDRTLGTNLKGPFLMSQQALPAMRKRGGGVIINIGATDGEAGAANAAAFAASKGGLIALTKSMAVDHAGEKIRVNVICPGMVDSPFHTARKRAEGAPDPAEAARLSLMGKLASPDDVAHLALYLASDEASWITGSVFTVNPGKATR
jgi:NAD(P)-dependent dehydrogenase (short-subunit alcohol dehydrogenase family)